MIQISKCFRKGFLFFILENIKNLKIHHSKRDWDYITLNGISQTFVDYPILVLYANGTPHFTIVKTNFCLDKCYLQNSEHWIEIQLLHVDVVYYCHTAVVLNVSVASVVNLSTTALLLLLLLLFPCTFVCVYLQRFFHVFCHL